MSEKTTPSSEWRRLAALLREEADRDMAVLPTLGGEVYFQRLRDYRRRSNTALFFEGLSESAARREALEGTDHAHAP